MMTQPFVQEALPTLHQNATAEFFFAVCQRGAEFAIKRDWLGPQSGYRLAFSRPGLLTFKRPLKPGPDRGGAAGEKNDTPSGPVSPPGGLADEPTESGTSEDPPRGCLIRQSGRSLADVKGSRAETLVEQTLGLAGDRWDAIHIFERDHDLPGVNGFEPGPTPLSQEIGKLFRDQLAAQRGAPSVNSDSQLGAQVLDVVLVEPDHWLVGWHLARRREQCQVGGVFPVQPPSQMISRAYLKMAEAVVWSGLPMQPGDRVVEIGSAPGGSCQRLLDLGLHVTGIDPAEMHPLLLSHPRFEHVRSKAAGVKRRFFSRFKWLVADANVAPNYTLDVVEELATYPTSRFQGLLLTFKLSNYEIVSRLDEYADRIHGWGFERVEMRQLASNRRELCVAAERTRR